MTLLTDNSAQNSFALSCLAHTEYLVTGLDEVVGKTLDGGGGVTGDLGLAVVADDDSLGGLCDSDAETAGSGVDASVLSSGHNISFTSNVETFSESLVLGGRVTANDIGDGLHLLGLELEVGRSSPGAVASNADDGTLVDVTAADEA
jgi:hypothetical protein